MGGGPPRRAVRSCGYHGGRTLAWGGTNCGASQAKRQRYLETVLEPLPIIPYTEQTAREHARIWAELEAAGKMIGYYDLILAATAVERGSEVATFNRKRFDLVRGLNVVEPRR